MKCPNCGKDSEFYWMPAKNEQGWSACQSCAKRPGEPEGFCPQLDRDAIEQKVACLLFLLDNEELVSVSNGSEGESLTQAVAKYCVNFGKYDQYTIIASIVCRMKEHGEYWKRISDAIIAGCDPRDRCECGKLSTCSVENKHYCREHWPAFVSEQLI